MTNQTTLRTVSVTCRCSYSYATKEYTLFPDELQSVDVYIEGAGALAGKFPKFVKAKASSAGALTFKAWLTPTGVTGAVNEAALKRVRKFAAVCAELGLDLTPATPVRFVNAVDRHPATI